MRVKRDFVKMERVRGRDVNIVEGLALHTDILSPPEQELVVSQVARWVEQVLRPC